MELQLNEKDLQQLITADEIHKQIFLERDAANVKLQEAQEELMKKQEELKEIEQKEKLLEWNITEFDGEAKRANSQVDDLSNKLQN